MVIENDEPLSPGGRLFVQPATHQIINTAFGLERQITPDALRTAISNSLIPKHPRFSSILVTDNHGREHWRKVELDIHHHVIVLPDPVGEGDNDEEVVNNYLADLTVSCPLDTNKPLWEFHLLSAHKCVVMRVHHALGDGISIVSLGITMCRKLDDPEQTPTIEHLVSSTHKTKEYSGTFGSMLKLLKVVWFSLMYMFVFLMRVTWVKDEKTVVRGGEGVELWPRKIATAKFSLQDMKMVKSLVANLTINDVLFGIISSGLSKYLDKRSPDPIQEGLQIMGAALVNLRPSPGLQDMKELMKKTGVTRGWGNKFGIMLLPIYYHRSQSPLEYLKRAKMMMDRKKLSMEALLTHQIKYFLMKYHGAKFASWLTYKILCNTSFTISNVVGPRDEMTVAGIPIKYIRTTISSLPHAIILHMVSYAGKADMQIQVAKDLIPDPENLAKCFEDALLEMKEYATQI